jgi:hypothetical protein
MVAIGHFPFNLLAKSARSTIMISFEFIASTFLKNKPHPEVSNRSPAEWREQSKY